MNLTSATISRRTAIKQTAAVLALPMGMSACVSFPPLLSTAQQLMLTASEVVLAIRDGRMTAEAYVTTLLARAKQLAGLNAILFLNESAALTAAKVIDAQRRRGAALPPLAGLPLLVKDNINTKDMPTSGGTPGLKTFQAKANSPVLQSLIDAGAIVLAKTNMHELAFGITSTNAATGFVKNPYDQTRIPGGSSGGTAAAIAARIAPAGLGTDTGGSTRVPSALCGTVGMRPSVGNGGGDRRYSGKGVIPISHTRDTVGVMARTVADTALLDAVISGAPVPLAVNLKGLRIGLPKAYFWDNLDAEVKSVMDGILIRLKNAGVVFVEADLVGIGALNDKISFPVALYETYVDLPKYLAAEGSSITIDQIAAQIKSPDVQGAFGAAKTFPKAAYDDAINTFRPQLQKLYKDYFANHAVNVILFPTTPLVATTIDPTFSGNVSINGVAQPGGPNAQFGAYIRNTDPGSNAGIPGLALPAGMTKGGLPVGLEIDGPLGSDQKLISVGLAIEALIGSLPEPSL
jgi:Asp-tRNA(Asn)/Glu-tRNA(Gln) amidotransferase A subunit family amidase